MSLFRIALAMACAFFAVGFAQADDWTASKLRGRVLQLIDNQWQPLDRGMVVPDTRPIRTLRSGRVTLVRGNETVDVGPDSEIQIVDRGGSKPFTTVKQQFGTVSVEAEVRQVQHFAVQTPYLAAVVKGTRFTVTSGKGGASVSVQRGHVEVDDLADKSHVTISIGQSVSIDLSKTRPELKVSGRGALPEVLDAKGRPIELDDKKDGHSAVSDDLSGVSKDSLGAIDLPEEDGTSGSDGSSNGGANSDSGSGNQGRH